MACNVIHSISTLCNVNNNLNYIHSSTEFVHGESTRDFVSVLDDTIYTAPQRE